jgi:hypothetical protein
MIGAGVAQQAVTFVDSATPGAVLIAFITLANTALLVVNRHDVGVVKRSTNGELDERVRREVRRELHETLPRLVRNAAREAVRDTLAAERDRERAEKRERRRK